MKGIKYILIIALLFPCYISGEAQLSNINELSPKQLQRFAINALRAGDLHTTIYFYEQYHKLKPDNHNVNYKLAELHRKVRNYEDAKKLYLLVYNKAGLKYPEAQFYYAQMLKSTGEYELAILEFTEFRKNYKNRKNAKEMGRMARNEIIGCDSARMIIQNPLNITINKPGTSVNSKHMELSPIPVDDNSFIYASLKIDSLIYFTDENVDTEMPVRQFYTAKKEGMDWIGGDLLSGVFNIPGVETGNGVFSRDRKRFYFTRCEQNWLGKIICALYRSDKEDGKWTDPVKLPPIINAPNYTSTQPALGRTARSDREIIFFVSDRPEGKGGLDIWYVVWNDKKDLFSEPRNLGSKINTPGDEMTPFYDLTTRKLYFSSTGLPGIGGLDIFSAFGERNKWTNVKNIGYPLNSSFDDLYFTVSKKGEDGFFVSNRPDTLSKETCCDDIFYYRWNDYIRITVTGIIYPFETDRFGRKKDLSDFDFMSPDESVKPLENAKIALYMLDKESKEYIFMDRFTTEKNGKFYFTLFPDQEYEFKMEGFQYFDSKNYLSTEFFNFSDTIEMPPTWVNVMSGKPIVLENIYYDFNESVLKQEARNAIDTTLLVMLKEAPEFIIEIGSHTDSIGEYQYNIDLSQQRADNVVKYLITKGIPVKRLVAKGYGASQPLAPNFNSDGSDNTEGRNKNRRTEFRIVGSIYDLDEEDEVYVEDKK